MENIFALKAQFAFEELPAEWKVFVFELARDLAERGEYLASDEDYIPITDYVNSMRVQPTEHTLELEYEIPEGQAPADIPRATFSRIPLTVEVAQILSRRLVEYAEDAAIVDQFLKK